MDKKCGVGFVFNPTPTLHQPYTSNTKIFPTLHLFNL